MKPTDALKQAALGAGLLAVAGLLLAGCSGLRPYPDSFEKNLFITTATDSGSLFSKVRAELDIFAVTPDCGTEYRGTVKLDRAKVEVGIPAGEVSYLSFVFLGSSLLGGTRSSMSHETLLRARRGSTYGVRVSYDDDIYDVEIEERRTGGNGAREVEIKDIGSCGEV